MRHLIIPFILLVAIITLLVHGPIPQDQSYHSFADQRSVGAIPNFSDVITNLPFLLIGILGLLITRRLKPYTIRRICRVLFIGFILLAFGSGWYHWQPNDLTLMYDRIPIAIIFMSFLCLFIHDHIGEWYGHNLLTLLNMAGVGSVLWWYVGEQAGQGDLRAYALVQFFPLVAIPLIMHLFRSRYDHWRELLSIYLFFILAKLAETFDVQIFLALGQLISGHTLKHVFMALAGATILLLLKKRIQLQIN